MHLSCACEHCLRHQRFKEASARAATQDKAFFESMMDSLVNAEDSRDYYKSIVQNKWPGASEILASYRS